MNKLDFSPLPIKEIGYIMRSEDIGQVLKFLNCFTYLPMCLKYKIITRMHSYGYNKLARKKVYQDLMMLKFFLLRT